jgi:hypothetical protein
MTHLDRPADKIIICCTYIHAACNKRRFQKKNRIIISHVLYLRVLSARPVKKRCALVVHRQPLFWRRAGWFLTFFPHSTAPHSTYIGMPCLGSARLVFNSLRVPASLRSLYSSFASSISTTTRLVPRRAFSIMANSHDNLFDYTSGAKALGGKSHTCCSVAYISDLKSNLFRFNDTLRRTERRLVFDVEGATSTCSAVF